MKVKAILNSGYFANTRHATNYIAYIDRQSPIFDQNGTEKKVLSAQVEVEAPGNSTVWRHVYSLNASDCERLGVDRNYMKNLIALKADELAKAYNISTNNLRMVCSWHNKDFHPHLHFLVWSTDNREAFIPHREKEADKSAALNAATRKVKSSFTNEIFRGDLEYLKEEKSKRRDKLNEQLRKLVSSEYLVDREITDALKDLGKELRETPGKHTYKFLLPQLKAEVDGVLEKIMQRDPILRPMYEEYLDSQKELALTYASYEETLDKKFAEIENSFFHPYCDFEERRAGRAEVTNEVARLSTLRSSHMSQIFELQDKIAIGYPASIQKVEESLDAVSKDIDVYKANSRFNPDGSEKFSAIVMGTTYTERKAADAALRDALQGATAGDVIIGQYRGFNIHAYYDAKAVSFMGYLQGEQKYNFEFNPKENFSSFRHLLEKLSDTQALDQERLTILNKNLEDAKEAVNQPFAYEKEFQTKLARLNELNTILNQEGGKTDVHPEIQELQAKIDQTYAAMAADPQKYLEYLNFRGQCVGMGVENSVAVFAQNPKATYCPSPEAIGSPKVKPGEEDRSISVLRTDGIERVYALEQYDLPESEYLDKAPLQWTEAQHSDLIHRVEDAAQLADISVLSDLRHGTGFFDASRNVIHIREGNNSTEQLKSLLEGYSEAVITRTSTSDKPVAELESAALTALLQVRCGVPIDDQLAERITAALEDAGNVGGFSMRDSVARLHNAMEYCVRYAELEQTSEQYQAQQIEPEELTPQSEAFMEMM